MSRTHSNSRSTSNKHVDLSHLGAPRVSSKLVRRSRGRECTTMFLNQRVPTKAGVDLLDQCATTLHQAIRLPRMHRLDPATLRPTLPQVPRIPASRAVTGEAEDVVDGSIPTDDEDGRHDKTWLLGHDKDESWGDDVVSRAGHDDTGPGIELVCFSQPFTRIAARRWFSRCELKAGV
jgi:hypothetical protein